MKAFWTIILLCTLGATARAQGKADSLLQWVKTYAGDIAHVAADNLGNLFLVSSTGQVKKFNANGDSVTVYNQMRNFGKLHTLDVSNPLQPLLFYKDFSTVVLLDRFLANRATIDLRRSGILQPGAAGISYDNNVWVFDEWDNKLKKLNDQGKVLLETADFRTAFGQTIRPQRIIDNNTFVYLADSASGILVFDIYGTYKKRIDLKGWRSLAVKDNWIISTTGQAVEALHLNSLQQRRWPLLAPPLLQALVSDRLLVLYAPDQAQVYRLRW